MHRLEQSSSRAPIARTGKPLADRRSASEHAVDGEGGDFLLALPTDPGLALPWPYDRDADDEPRGADGSWDRGAFEYDSR